MTADEAIALLKLEPHPEGGYFRETFRDAGAPLVLTISPNGHDAHAQHLGPNLETGQRPQLVVQAGHWQTATTLGPWTLVGCTVAPAFDFAAFEMAPPDWRPSPRG